MKKDTHIRKLARMYRDGEEKEVYGSGAIARFAGLQDKLTALRMAQDYGINKDEILNEVAQIDIEEEDAK